VRVDTYLQRIGYRGPREPTASVLQAFRASPWPAALGTVQRFGMDLADYDRLFPVALAPFEGQGTRNSKIGQVSPFDPWPWP
jgi:hypothetical protein